MFSAEITNSLRQVIAGELTQIILIGLAREQLQKGEVLLMLFIVGKLLPADVRLDAITSLTGTRLLYIRQVQEF